MPPGARGRLVRRGGDLGGQVRGGGGLGQADRCQYRNQRPVAATPGIL